MMDLKSLFSALVSLFYPPRCPLCGDVTSQSLDGALCDACRRRFDEEFSVACPRCGKAPASCKCVPTTVRNESDISPYTTAVPLIFSGYYRGYDDSSAVSALVYKMKRSHSSGASYVFARTIAQSVSRFLAMREFDPKDFTVTYIPRSKTSLDKYGFDHMKAVSRTVARLLGCGFSTLLIRDGGTEQKALSANERMENARDTISPNIRRQKEICGAKIILLDDIVTTGASMTSAVSALSFAGASVIVPACAMVSKTDKKKD